MDDTYDEDLEAEAAAMAEAMGFTGFGMRDNNKKRKFNPNADSAVAEEPAEPSFTGANTAPLGQRRRPQMNLPPPGSGGGNADEIDLDEGEEGDGGWAGQLGGGGGGGEDASAGGVSVVGSDASAIPSRPSGDVAHAHAHAFTLESTGALASPARVDALVTGDSDPAGTATGAAEQQQQQQHHHQDPSRPQQPRAGKGARWTGQHVANAAHAAKAAGLPWWEGPWDPKLIDRMIDNPWDRLERQRGLGSRGTWGRKEDDDDGDTAGSTASRGAGAQAVGVSTNEAVVA